LRKFRFRLDILVFQPEEYRRLIGSEAGCGVAEAYCSWPSFLLDEAPFAALSILSLMALPWRGLPPRELVLGALAVAICSDVAWRLYGRLPGDPQRASTAQQETNAA